MEIALAATVLALPVALGALAGATRSLGDGAIDPLNRYALHFAFPALVARGIADGRFSAPGEPLFWLAIPIVLLTTLLVIAILAPQIGLREERGTLALTVAFGNVAYLGLPMVEQLFGASALGIASIAVALHVACGMIAGPYLLLRWSGRPGERSAALRRALEQPLLYAPLAGALLRFLPWRDSIAAVLEPLGRSASPVALFLLGLYLWVHRDELRRFDRADLAHAIAKLAVLPALTFALCKLARLPSLEAKVLVLLAAMPSAVTTFALGRDLGVGAQRLSRGVVITSLLSAVTLPVAAWLLIFL